MTDDLGPAESADRPHVLPPDVILMTAEVAGWPTVEFSGALTIEGAAGWRSACAKAGAIVGERRRLLDTLGAPWASAELLATEAARDRLRDWYAAGARVPTPDDLVRRLRFLGDSEARSIVLEALHLRVPAPVVAFLLERALFASVGWSSLGRMIWTEFPPGPVAFIPISGASRDRSLVLDLALHEASHAWLLTPPERAFRAEQMYNEHAVALLEAAARPELMGAWLRTSDLWERQADALAATWGATLGGANDRARWHTIREARALCDTYGKASS